MRKKKKKMKMKMKKAQETVWLLFKASQLVVAPCPGKL